MFEPRVTRSPTAWDDEDFSAAMASDRPALSSMGLLGSTVERPHIRQRLHTICALYAHAPTAEARTKLLDELELMAMQVAATLAEELLESGWTPDSKRR